MKNTGLNPRNWLASAIGVVVAPTVKTQRRRIMTKTVLSYLKVAAFVAVLGIALAQSISPSSAGPLVPPANPLPEVDIASELQTLDSFTTDWGKFDAKRAELRKKSSLTSSEFQLLNDDHGALKRRLSQIPNAIRAII